MVTVYHHTYLSNLPLHPCLYALTPVCLLSTKITGIVFLFSDLKQLLGGMVYATSVSDQCVEVLDYKIYAVYLFKTLTDQL